MKKLCWTAVLAVIVLNLTGCKLVNQIRLRNANDDVQPQWNNQSQHIALPTQYIGEKPYIMAEINGIPGFKFLVDTGASITILKDTDKVKALKLSRGYDLALGGWGDGDASPAYQTELSKLSLSGVDFENWSVAYIPSKTTAYFLREDEAIYDGVIGHDLMRHFTWTFDKFNNTVAIQTKPFEARDGDIAIPFDTFLSKPFFEGELDMGIGEPDTHEFIIDTGSRHYLKVSQTYLDNRDIELPQTAITAADFGLNGKAEHQRVTMPSLTLSGHKIGPIKTNLIVTDDEDDLWVIGSALLNQYFSVIDYSKETMYLRPVGEHKFASRYNLMGLELRKLTSGDFVVRFVFPGLPGQDTNIQVGDVVTQINGVDSKDISMDDWLALTATPGKYNICLAEQKGCLALTSAHIPGYSDTALTMAP